MVNEDTGVRQLVRAHQPGLPGLSQDDDRRLRCRHAALLSHFAARGRAHRRRERRRGRDLGRLSGHVVGPAKPDAAQPGDDPSGRWLGGRALPPDVPVPYVMTVGLYLGALARAVSVDPMMAHVYAAASPDVLAALSEVPIHGLLVRLLDERAHFRPSYGIDLIMAEHVSSVDRMQAVIGAVAGTYGLRHRAESWRGAARTRPKPIRRRLRNARWQHGSYGQGVYTNVLVVATGISRAMLRTMREEIGMPSEGDGIGHLRQSHRIVHNRRRLVEGSVFIMLYDKIAENARENVDFDALLKAFAMYSDFHHYTYPLGGADPLSINEAYVLARDFRTSVNKVALLRCNKCDSPFIVVAEQRVASSCPIMLAADARRHGVRQRRRRRRGSRVERRRSACSVTSSGPLPTPTNRRRSWRPSRAARSMT
jgi:hypothetical protein